MKIRNFLKKTLAVVLAFAMLAPIMGNLEVNYKEVKAEETSLDDSLNVKCQVTQGVVTDTSIDKYRGNYVIRFVSAVKDYTAYSEIGFKVMEEGQTESEAKTAKVKTVFKRIESTTGSTATEKETYAFSPKVINTDAEYFITAKLPVAPANKAVNYTVWAYGIKKDGTPVEGQKRCLSVEDGQRDCETINMSFENTSSDDLTGLTLKANDTYDAKVIGVNDKTVHVRISDVPKPLKSATSFTFKNDDTKVGRGIFRNLYTEYDPDGDGTGTADDSWYKTYLEADSTETEFTIATSADLYGLASLVNATEGNVTFADKTIYVVSDIKVNKGTAKDIGWVAATDASIYPWTPIGTASKPFSGTFDGCMHSISGIFVDANNKNAGLFGYIESTSNNVSSVMNMMLKNSYFVSMSANFGSVVGEIKGGVIDTVKSDAIVKSSNAFHGGLVGMTEGAVTILNCWFAGKVTNTVTNSTKNIRVGGMVGGLYTGSLTIENCLNTGNIDISQFDNGNYPQVGGFVGEVGNSSKPVVTITIKDCLNTASISVKSTAKRHGAIMGYVRTGVTAEVYSTYADSDKCSVAIGDGYQETPVINIYDSQDNVVTDDKMLITNSAITGDMATSATGLVGFDFNDYWTIVTNGTPILASFKDEIINPDTSWYSEEGGTAENPFVLYDKNDLYGFANLVNAGNNFAGKIIRLGDDVVINKGDAEDYAECVPQFEWTPIGTTAATAFAGTFDGSDPETGEIHSISGIYLNTSDANAGLFGVVETTGSVTATIQNLKLKNSYFETTKADFGSIAGRVKGATFDTIYSDAIVVSSNSRVGGFIGIGTRTVTMNSCWFAGNVKNTYNTKYPRAAAFVGNQYSDTLTMTNCLNTGTMDVSAYTVDNYPLSGCFVGEVGYKVDNTPTYSNANVTITDCLNTGKKLLGKTSTAYGEIIGYVRPGSKVDIDTTYIDTSNGTAVFGYNEGTVTVDDATIGNSGKSNTTASVTHANMSGETAKTNLTGFDFDTVWTVVANSTPILTSFASKVFVPDTTWYDASEYTYILYNRADLYGLAELSKTNNFAGKTIKLGADIVVNEGDAEDWAEKVPDYEWQSIGSTIKPFAGTFDGQGHTISGVYLNTDERYAGLFKWIQSPTDGTAIVQNLKLTNSYFETNDADCGSIAGRATGAIHTVYSDAIVVSNSSRVGGFVGMGHTDLDMDECWFAGRVVNTCESSNSTGGFIGNMYVGDLTMDNCLNTGHVDVSANRSLGNDGKTYYPKAGGFIGLHGYDSDYSATATITNCLNTGTKCVYDVVKTSYGAFTGYMNPYSSLTVNSSYVDSDKCDGRGYFAADNTTNPVDGYTTDIFKSYEEITGTNAETSLDDFDFTSTWTVAESGNVILACFEEMEVLATSTNALHQTLIVNEELNVSEVTSVATLPKTSNWSDTMSYQGGCTTDGRYFYQALITYKDEADETQDGTLKEADNLVKIFKYDKDTQQVVWSEELNLNHANDITYNSKLGYFVVCHNQGGANKVSYISIDTDEETGVESINLVETVTLEENIYSIDYNAKYDQYIVGMSGGQEFTVLDSNFQQKYSFKPKSGTTPVYSEEKGTYVRYVTQGICCDDNYIYCILEEPDKIVVYDWLGSFVSLIDMTEATNYSTELEPENISVVGDTIYFTAFSEGTWLNYQNSAVVYKFSATNLVEKTSAQ